MQFLIQEISPKDQLLAKAAAEQGHEVLYWSVKDIYTQTDSFWYNFKGAIHTSLIICKHLQSKGVKTLTPFTELRRQNYYAYVNCAGFYYEHSADIIVRAMVEETAKLYKEEEGWI